MDGGQITAHGLENWRLVCHGDAPISGHVAARIVVSKGATGQAGKSGFPGLPGLPGGGFPGFLSQTRHT